jgi:hypothetical protein
MLPASDLADILANLGALNLQPNTAAQILAAVLAPLLRSADPRPAGSPAPARRTATIEAAQSPAAEAEEIPVSGGGCSCWRARRRPAPARRTRARGQSRRLADPCAEIAGVSRSTVANARGELGAEARKPKPAKPLTESRQRAQRFLRDTLAHGPKRVTDVEEAAEKAHVDAHALAQAR